MRWISFPDDSLKVHGLAWFDEEKPSVRRLPSRLKDTFPEAVWGLAQDPAGGRIRFRTDSLHVGIRAQCPDNAVMNHITRIGQSGFDVYVDNNFMGSVAPDASGAIETDWTIAAAPKMREITLNMPLYKSVEISAVGLDEDAAIQAPQPFALAKPVVFYGTSITQGGCASTPGTTYQSFLSRWLNIDFINLGFSGSGLGEPELAVAMSRIDSSCVVIDHWANIGGRFAENLPQFIGPIRENRPEAPIIVMGPFYFCGEDRGEQLHIEQRKAAMSFVRTMNRQGDKNITYFDGLKMISRETSFGLVDGVHCNSLGFYLAAKGFAPHLKRVLGL